MAEANPNFGALLDKPASMTEKPKPAPVGHYICVIQGQPKQDKSTKKQTEYVEFTYKVVQASDDVDAGDLDKFLTAPDGSKRPLSDVTFRDTYYLTENSLWRLKDMLRACGFEVDEGDASYRQMIAETPGQQLLVQIRHEGSGDGKNVYANVGSVAAVE